MLIALVESNTTAFRLRNALSVEVIQAPRRLTGGSCGNAVRFTQNMLPELLSFAADHGIEIKKVYQEHRRFNSTEYIPFPLS